MKNKNKDIFIYNQINEILNKEKHIMKKKKSYRPRQNFHHQTE